MGGRPGARTGPVRKRGAASQKPKPASTSLAELLIDVLPDALLALSLDGRILSWNRRAVAIFGYRAEEAIGRPLEDLIIREEGRSEARKAVAEVVETGATLFEAVGRHKDGSLLQVETSLRL